MQSKVALTVCCCILFTSLATAQINFKNRNTGNNRGSQWWVGVKAGANFTNPNIGERYNVFSFTQQIEPTNALNKYKNFSAAGSQFGFIIAFEFINNFSAAISPELATYKYQYETSFAWASLENNIQTVNINYTHKTDLLYLDIPLTFRYQLLKGKTKPYIQAGAYIGHLLKATKTTNEEIVDNATGGNTIYENNEYAGNAENLFIKPNWGLMAGFLVTHNIGNARLGLSANYRYGMNNITDVKNRFSDNQFLTGTFNAQDDIKLTNIEISLICVIPLKFITSDDYVPL